jgi:putative DNA primase/helicase
MTQKAKLAVLSNYGTDSPLKYFGVPAGGGRAVFVPSTLGEELWVEGGLLVGPGGALYRYDGGVYVRDGKQWVKDEVRRRLGDEYRKTREAEVLAWCQAHLDVPFNLRNAELINLSNGLLDWRTRTLHDHRPDHVSTVQLPIAWDNMATCPQIDSFLAFAAPGMADFIFEILGLLLIPETRFRKAILLLGQTGTGKSTFLDLIKAMLGDGNYSAIPLQALSDDRFKVAELYGKLANICSDIDYRASKSSGTFKQIVGGTDTIVGERKFEHPFHFVPTSRLLFSANTAPASSDQTDAYFVRWLVLPFENKPAKEDRTLNERLTSPSELSGLLVKAVAGLLRLAARGDFEVPAAAVAALKEYRETIDSVARFFRDEVLVGPKMTMKTSEVYGAYKRWCDLYGERYPVRDAQFIERLGALAPGARTVRIHGYNTWQGLQTATYL